MLHRFCFCYFFLYDFLFFFCFSFFFFNDTATTEIYTLSLHDALPICYPQHLKERILSPTGHLCNTDRKSTRLNSSHQIISYAVFCLKKKKKKKERGRGEESGRREIEANEVDEV